jgi:hypothetical protein
VRGVEQIGNRDVDGRADPRSVQTRDERVSTNAPYRRETGPPPDGIASLKATNSTSASSSAS